jgi:predicted dehydrogenase
VTHVGLVGCGKWGRFILRDLVALGCRVTVLARSDATARRAKEGGAMDVVGAVDDLPDLDGVIVAVPAVDHAEVVDSVLDRGVPVFVEKPLTVDPVWAANLAAAPTADRVFVMDKWRYHPGVELLRDIARSGELGAVVGLETTRIGWGNPHADIDGIWHLAPHDLAIVLEILGSIPEPHSARTDRAHGALAGIVALFGEEPWVRMEVGTRSVRRIRSVTLRCENGIAALMDGYGDHLEILTGYPSRDREPEPVHRPFAMEMPLLRELRVFVDHLRGGPPPRSSAVEGAMMVTTIATLRKLAGVREGGDR